MIRTSRAKNILENDIIAFTHSKENLTIAEQEELERVMLFDYKIDEEVFSFEKELFFKTLMNRFIERYDVYLYFIQKRARKKSKLRSHKKMMFPHRKSIGLSTLFEEEVLLEDEKTLLYSIVFLTEKNRGYTYKHLLDSRFSFAVIREKNENKEERFNGMSLADVIKDSLNPKKSTFDLSLLKVLNKMISEQSSVIRKFSDGFDKLHLNLFYQNEYHLEFIKAEMNKQFRVQER